jgi:hypothetical protein
MTPELANGLVAPFLANGIIGSICVALALYILKLQAEAKNERAAHKVEMAAKDVLIKELYDSRVAEAKAGYEVLKNNERTMEAFFVAVSGRSQK